MISYIFKFILIFISKTHFYNIYKHILINIALLYVCILSHYHLNTSSITSYPAVFFLFSSISGVLLLLQDDVIIRLIAMHLTIRTKCLCFHKWTFIASHTGIFCQFLTLTAHKASCMMITTAIQLYHLRDHLFFLFTFSVNICIFSFHLTYLFHSISAKPEL